MNCDICGTQGQGILLSARQVRAAAAAGFNPIKLGLLHPTAKKAAEQDQDAAFQAWSLVVSKNDTGWNFCSACAKALQPYVPMDTGASAQTLSPSAEALKAELTHNATSVPPGICDLCLSVEAVVKVRDEAVRKVDSKKLTKLIPNSTLLRLGPTVGTGLGAWGMRIAAKADAWGFCGDCARGVNELLPEADKAAVPAGAPKRAGVPDDPVERVEWLANELRKRQAPAKAPEVGGYEKYDSGDFIGFVVCAVVAFAVYLACHH